MLSRTLRCLVLVAMASTIYFSPAAAGGPASFEEAQQWAADQGKLILVDFFADWCGPCKRFSADVEADAALQEGLSRVVFFKIDAEKGAGIPLAERYKVDSFPNYLLADATGEPIARWVGYEDPENFLGTLNENLADPTTLGQKLQRYESQPNARDAASLGSAAMARKEYGESAGWYKKAAAFDGGFEGEIFLATIYGMRSKEFSNEELVAAADAAMATGDLETQLLVFQFQRDMAKMADDETLAYRYLEDVWGSMKDEDSPEFASMRTAVEIDHALYIEKDEERAAELKYASMPEGWLESAGRLNSYAWWCFENQVDLERAESLARKGVELASTPKEKAMILDTAAELCNSLGECHEAVSLIEQAIQNDPESEYYQKQLTRFRELASAQG